MTSGELLGTLCKVIGPQVYEECRTQILFGIQNNLERQTVEETNDQAQHEALRTKLTSPKDLNGQQV